jgi:hypothetical protein
VENNGQRRTFLDNIKNVSVLYTESNKKDRKIVHGNDLTKGIKERDDVWACINYFGMRDGDLVVKMTGRYYLSSDCQFMQLLRTLDWKRTKAIVKFGSYYNPKDSPLEDCITGLIMMPVAAIKTIAPSKIIEWEWAKAALALPKDQLYAVVGQLGIFIAPGGGANYFLV